MRFNTLTKYPMTADYRAWEPLLDKTTQLTYRKYENAEQIDCQVFISQTGILHLTTSRSLQPFGIIQHMRDAAGEPVMDENWYTIQRVVPVFDSFGHVSSYRHSLAVLDPRDIEKPINPPQSYPQLDQAP